MLSRNDRFPEERVGCVYWPESILVNLIRRVCQFVQPKVSILFTNGAIKRIQSLAQTDKKTSNY